MAGGFVGKSSNQDLGVSTRAPLGRFSIRRYIRETLPDKPRCRGAVHGYFLELTRRLTAIGVEERQRADLLYRYHEEGKVYRDEF
jgi:hypothetical protein